jgi:hypothetical protein
MNEGIQEAVFKDLEKKCAVSKISDIKLKCSVCEEHIKDTIFEVLTYYDTQIIVCRDCMHDILNQIQLFIKQTRVNSNNGG